MNIASVFNWFSRESLRAAEHTENPRQREILLKLAVLWEAAGGPRRSIAAIDFAEYGRTPRLKSFAVTFGRPSASRKYVGTKSSADEKQLPPPPDHL